MHSLVQVTKRFVLAACVSAGVSSAAAEPDGAMDSRKQMALIGVALRAALIPELRLNSAGERLALLNQRLNEIAQRERAAIGSALVVDRQGAPSGPMCEDIALGKYALLQLHGDAGQQVRLLLVKVYVGQTQRIEPHLVVAVYRAHEADPLILDNLRPEIATLSNRPDLVPVASFDQQGWSRGATAVSQFGFDARFERWRQLAQNALAQH